MRGEGEREKEREGGGVWDGERGREREGREGGVGEREREECVDVGVGVGVRADVGVYVCEHVWMCVGAYVCVHVREGVREGEVRCSGRVCATLVACAQTGGKPPSKRHVATAVAARALSRAESEPPCARVV